MNCSTALNKALSFSPLWVFPNYLIKLDAEETKPLQLNLHNFSLDVPLFLLSTSLSIMFFFFSCLYGLLACEIKIIMGANQAFLVFFLHLFLKFAVALSLSELKVLQALVCHWCCDFRSLNQGVELLMLDLVPHNHSPAFSGASASTGFIA